MQVVKQDDGRWRYGAKVFDTEAEVRAFEVQWLDAKDKRSVASVKIANADSPVATAVASQTDTGILKFSIGTAVVIAFAAALYSCKNNSSTKKSDVGDAWIMCKSALKIVSLDPEKAEIPFVQDQGTASEFSFAWSRLTKMVRLRNALGFEMPATATCTVDKASGKLKSLTINEKIYWPVQGK